MFVNEVSTIWTEKVHDYKVPKSEVRSGWAGNHRFRS